METLLVVLAVSVGGVGIAALIAFAIIWAAIKISK